MGQFQEEKKKHDLEYFGDTHKKNQVHKELFVVVESDEGNLGMNNL